LLLGEAKKVQETSWVICQKWDRNSKAKPLWFYFDRFWNIWNL